MSFDEPTFDNGGDGPLPEETDNNRTFKIAVGILGGFILISIACFAAVYVFGLRGKSSAAQAQANANATATAAVAFINDALTATNQALISLPTTTSTPVPTSVVKLATATEAVTPQAPQAALDSTSVANTATIGAAYTQAAAAQASVVVTTTALPKTGIADEFGLPGLVVMALAFVIVILLARRLRTAPSMNR
jgi:hypothetical protein